VATRQAATFPSFLARKLLCRRGHDKSIATADGGDLQVEGGVFRVAAVVEDFDVCLMAADDADQGSRFMVLAEVGAKTALTVVNCFHDIVLSSPERGCCLSGSVVIPMRDSADL
jgi:hypothetical protein